MKLNNDLEAFLDMVAMNPQDQALHRLGPVQARTRFELATQRLRWQAPQDLALGSLTCTARDGTALPLRVYKPAQADGRPLPVLVYFHGGGFVVGSLDSHDGVCRELCARSGCAVVSVGYRLAPEHRFPTAFEDGWDVLEALPSIAQAQGLDLQRVVLAGDSVGATLATTLALHAARQGLAAAVRPIGQLLCYPVTDAGGEYASRTLFGEGYLLEDETLEWFYDLYAREHLDRHDWRFSPLRAESLSGVAPAIVLLAGLDPLLDEGQAYAERLQASGVDVEIILAQDMTHDLLRMMSVTAEVSTVYKRLVDSLLALIAKAR
ncbi:alpha/beta hydrolase [Pseudomonas putida]|uniref:alpha/beta hydrolase n=1 Tax=Pseudomonas TaxID=286 RepID=UPI00164610B3|nr:alpha/beta hydrolase [Pseudomonas putida]EKT4558881.1 alpha/beta hydrolase [Pseudomonas putida]MDP9542230.1 alpha/beta hydrolase [Pseudomonas putida]